jgi:two-component system response regulator AtoC
MYKPILFIIDDNSLFIQSLNRALRGDYEIRSARTLHEAQSLLNLTFDIALVDICLNENDSTNQDGIAFLKQIKMKSEYIPVLMITAYADIERAIECTKLGAIDFIQKAQANISEIKTRLRKALEHSKLNQRIVNLEKELFLVEPRKIIGQSNKIQEIKRSIKAVADDGNVSVLIRGETGTGKELVARSIYENGWRKTGNFVPVTINALPIQTIEAELFGYEPGAFTDAKERHVGYLEKSDRGVLFLDEIGDLSLSMQSKLLRFLEEREFNRLGSTIPIKIDNQILAATNKNLEELIKQKKFREDLYFRLNVYLIQVPPLREHNEDIPSLVEHFLELFYKQGRKIRKISNGSLEILKKFYWPGNVRQLKNTIESSIFYAFSKGHSQIELDDIPLDIRQNFSFAEDFDSEDGTTNIIPVKELLARQELKYIEKALKQSKGKKAKAWKILGYNDRFTLYRRITQILQRFPHLSDEFSGIKSAIKGK